MTPVGYEAPLRQAVWRRNLTYRVPHLWFCVWFMLLGLLGTVSYRIGAAWLPGRQWWVCLSTMAVWGLALLWMQWKTQQDPHWDELFLADLTTRPQRYYDAG